MAEGSMDSASPIVACLQLATHLAIQSIQVRVGYLTLLQKQGALTGLNLHNVVDSVYRCCALVLVEA